MTSASGGKYSVSGPLTVRTAVLLAARLFPNRAREDQAAWRHVVDLQDAHFLTTGQMHLWDAWPKLPDADQVRITRMLRQRPAFLASRTVFLDEAAALLASGEQAEFADTEGEHQVLVLASAAPEARIDALLDELEQGAAKTTGFPEPAQPGSYVSDLRM
ncbi:hypothetical protein ABZ769_20900 [Streptomyces olivoreticuli]